MTHHTIQMGQPGRRTVLGLGAVAALTFLPPGREAHASPVSDHKLPALSAAGLPLLTGRLRHTTVLQSFGFDEPRSHIYALQIVEGGVRLPGEKTARTHAERAKSGDLCLNRLAMDGSPAGHMYLKGFGHGGALGIEASATAATLGRSGTPIPPPATGAESAASASPTAGFCRAPTADSGAIARSPAPPPNYAATRRSEAASAAALQEARSAALRPVRPRPVPSRNLPATARHGTARSRLGPALPRHGAVRQLRVPASGQCLRSAQPPPPQAAISGSTGSTCAPGASCTSRWNTRLCNLSPREPEGLAVLREGTPRLCLGLTEGPVGGRGFRLYYKALS